MFSAEVKINGATICILTGHNKYIKDGITTYDYEYFEPTIGIKSSETNRKSHIIGKVSCDRRLGIRHVLHEIFKNIDETT